MFCPLCKSEFVEGISFCVQCSTALVASLDLPEAHANARQLFWRGKDEKIFGALGEVLRDAEIACHFEGPPPSFVFGHRLTDSRIYVLKSDVARAVKIAAAIAERFGEPSPRGAMCHACRAILWPGFGWCYRCSAALRVTADPRTKRRATAPEESEEAPGSEDEARQFSARRCPTCGLLYPGTYKECTQCGVALVSNADAAGSEDESEDLSTDRPSDPTEEKSLVVVWRGGDPVSLSRIVGALYAGKIAHQVIATHDHLAFELGIPRPMYEVRVFGSDYQAARYFVLPIRETIPLALMPKEVVAAAKAEPPSPPPIADDFVACTPADAVALVWSGDDPAIHKMLRDCFFENRIVYRSRGKSPGKLELFVIPGQEARAREIVREVVEGAPPA